MSKKLPRNRKVKLNFPKKRFEIVVFAFLVSILLIMGVGVVLYRISPLWSPFRLVEAQTRNFGQAVKVVFESNIPLKTRLEYGTSDVYLNTTEESEEYKTKHEVYVASVLPERKHYIKLVGYSENGKVYESGFFTVE
ncbi:MAG: hypothetical protein WC243_00390 [Patescibacteria group bacterium]|jgi:hypothetical protein